MEFIYNNWMIFVGIIAVLAMGVYLGIRFFRLPKAQQSENIKHWLLWAVTEAEKKLGEGTGQLKLVTVYNMFIEKFPVVSAMMPFATFTALVDQALEEMKQMLEKNSAVKEIISNQEKQLS